MPAASTQGPISALVLMMELTGQARAFALPMLPAIVIGDRDCAADRVALDLRSPADRRGSGRLRAREPTGA